MDHWDHLRLFLAVARRQTLTAASRELGVNVSTLHRRLGAFEEEMGLELFEKGPRGYRLTNAGEALLPRAEEVEEAVFSATRAVVGHDQSATGEVRLTMPPSLLSLLANHLTAFTRTCKGIQPIIRADNSALSLERETDLAFRATTQPLDTAVGRNLCGLAWARYGPRENPDEDLPWVHYLGMNASPAVQWRRKHHTDARAILHVHSVLAMTAVLPSACAQGLLPCFLGDAHRELARIGPVVAENRLWLLVHADLRRSARVRAMIDFLVPRILAKQDQLEGRVGG